MNKKTIVAVLGLCALVATPAFARPDDNKRDNRGTERGREARGDRRQAPNPFEGLDLTADQQAKLDQLKKDCKAARQECKKENKEARKALADSCKAAGCKVRSEQLAKIKEILTPEQYVKFLENSFLMNGGPAGKPGKAGHHRR